MKGWKEEEITRRHKDHWGKAEDCLLNGTKGEGEKTHTNEEISPQVQRFNFFLFLPLCHLAGLIPLFFNVFVSWCEILGFSLCEPFFLFVLFPSLLPTPHSLVPIPPFYRHEFALFVIKYPMSQTMNDAFEGYYREIWGSRWEKLRESLLLPASLVPYGEGLTKPYMMDRASVLAALSLRLPSRGIILDACAAPGGKSLVLASHMTGDTNLLCNELSSERRRRLANVLDGHLDGEKRQKVTVSGFDAGKLGGKKSEWNRFDAILLDAPCSSERHVIQSEKAYSQWTPARPRFLSHRQWALLSAAFLLLKSGGTLVYATCALTPEENDRPASRLMEKYAGSIALDEPDFEEGEKTTYGRLILPDEPGGMGPMYVARFRKEGKR